MSAQQPMSDRPQPAAAIPTPVVSSVMRVEPAWIDYNGHLNMAYYNVLFDRAVDEVYEVLGLGLSLRRVDTGTQPSPPKCMSATCASCWGCNPVRVTFHLLGFDAKRMHYFEAALSRQEGWLSATSENMALNVDMASRRPPRFPDDVMAHLRA